MNDANDILWEGPQGALIRHRSMADGSHSTTVLTKDENDRAFFAGKVYQTYYEFTISASTSIVLKLVSTKDYCITHIDQELDDSVLKVQIKNGGTEDGTFSTSLPVITANTMANSPTVTSGMTITQGGTHTGGTASYVTKVSATKGGGLLQENQRLGYPANTNYVYLGNVGNQSINGFISIRWMEF